MEPAPEWTAEVEQSLAAVVAAVRAAGRNAAAQPLWRFLQRGGRLPAGRLPRGALAGPPVYEVLEPGGESPDSGAAAGAAGPVVRQAAGCAGCPPLLSARMLGDCVAAVTPLGEVLCSEHPREALVPVPLPLPAAAVSCGREGVLQREDAGFYAVALQRGGGAVCKWRLGTGNYRSRVASAPEIVQGLPSGDPVVAIEAGWGITVALTASGAAFGWGHRLMFCHFGASGAEVVRMPQLWGRRCIRRLSCGILVAAAETEAGELLLLGLAPSSFHGSLTFAQLPPDAGVAFPLRDIVAVRGVAVLVVDAMGRVFLINMAARPQGARVRVLKSLPAAAPQQRAVSVSIVRGACVVLTDSGELWRDASRRSRPDVQSISSVHPRHLRGLLPQSGIGSRALLLPDLSCARARVGLFARIAVRLGLPSDPVRVQFLRYAVQNCYIVGTEADPSSWPRPAAPPAAAAG